MNYANIIKFLKIYIKISIIFSIYIKEERKRS